MKIGFLTIKTGPLASGGLQMEQGLTVFLKERGNKIAGREVRIAYAGYRRQSGTGTHQDTGTGRTPGRCR